VAAGDGREVAIVSGAASGIGAACARELQAAGVAVFGLDLQPAEDCDGHAVVDVADAGTVGTAVATAASTLGDVRYAVTAAGYYERRPLLEIGPQAWRRMLDVQVGGTVNVCRAVVPTLRAARAGAVCTVGSELALIGDGDAPHYAAAKGAVHAFTKALALELAPHGVRVNVCAPGPTDTPLMTPELRDPAYIESLVLRRLVDPREVAATVRFLLLEPHNLVGQVVSPNAGAAM